MLHKVRRPVRACPVLSCHQARSRSTSLRLFPQASSTFLRLFPPPLPPMPALRPGRSRGRQRLAGQACGRGGRERGGPGGARGCRVLEGARVGGLAAHAAGEAEGAVLRGGNELGGHAQGQQLPHQLLRHPRALPKPASTTREPRQSGMAMLVRYGDASQQWRRYSHSQVITHVVQSSLMWYRHH